MNPQKNWVDTPAHAAARYCRVCLNRILKKERQALMISAPLQPIAPVQRGGKLVKGLGVGIDGPHVVKGAVHQKLATSDQQDASGKGFDVLHVVGGQKYRCAVGSAPFLYE